MIRTEKEYKAILARIDELLMDPENIENEDAKGYIELNLLSGHVVDYEERISPVKNPLAVDGGLTTN